jgi:methanogenic corrinoid protein MtbC1
MTTNTPPPRTSPQELLDRIAEMVERGKPDAAAPHPRELAEQPGALELTRAALDAGIAAQDILRLGLMKGMTRVGEKFRDRLIYVPDVLLAARAMKVAMELLQPSFTGGHAHYRGVFILGTVQGDLHDIGKRLVGMIAEGAGYRIVDLGIDVRPGRFVAAVAEHPGAAVGLSALLTTTMANMPDAVRAIRQSSPETRIIVGGAPVTARFAESIGADAYGADPYAAVEFLGALFPDHADGA